VTAKCTILWISQWEFNVPFQHKYDKNKNASLTKKYKYNQDKKLKPGLVTSYDIQTENGVGLFWQNERDGKTRK